MVELSMFERSPVLTAAAKQQLTIAVITETYPPEINGVSKTIAIMVKELCNRGHTIRLFRPDQRNGIRVNGHMNIHDTTLPGVTIPFYQDLRFGLPARRKLVKHWLFKPVHLVHVVTEGPLGWSAVRAANRLGLPVVSDYRTNYQSYSRYYRLGLLHTAVDRYMRYLHNSTRYTLVPTHEVRDSLQTSGYHNVAVVGRGIDTALYNPAKRDWELRKSWGLSPTDTAALYVGRLAPEKNIHLAIQAYRQMQYVDPSLRLIMVGDGPSRKDLQESHPEVIFAGMQQGESLARHYASGDIFIFPSITETFGNVILEAMASGLGIVAYDYAAAKEYLRHRRSAMLARFDDPDDFIKQACLLVSRKDNVKTLRTSVLETAKKCTWEKVICDLEAIYKNITAKPTVP